MLYCMPIIISCTVHNKRHNYVYFHMHEITNYYPAAASRRDLAARGSVRPYVYVGLTTLQLCSLRPCGEIGAVQALLFEFI